MQCPGGTQTDFGCIPNDPVGFVGKFYGIGLGIIGAVALMALIYGGYKILISQGNPMILQRGKDYVVYAIIGLVLAIFGYIFVKIVAIDILHIPGFN